jgi:hypothetical protein
MYTNIEYDLFRMAHLVAALNAVPHDNHDSRFCTKNMRGTTYGK